MVPRMNGHSKRRGSPRLPWKRGPAAWKVACRGGEILERLACSTRRFLSLREAARVLKVSTQPLRDWVIHGYLERSSERLLFSTEELSRFVNWLAERAEPFGADDYLRRLYRRRGLAVFPFSKLYSAQFAWPKARTALSPKELSQLAGCHPSLVVMAIRQNRVRGRRRTPHRWEITRRAWKDAFPMTVG